jgi:hypothetical protein
MSHLSIEKCHILVCGCRMWHSINLNVTFMFVDFQDVTLVKSRCHIYVSGIICDICIARMWHFTCCKCDTLACRGSLGTRSAKGDILYTECHFFPVCECDIKYAQCHILHAWNVTFSLQNVTFVLSECHILYLEYVTFQQSQMWHIQLWYVTFHHRMPHPGYVSNMSHFLLKCHIVCI